MIKSGDCLGAICRRLEIHGVRALMCTCKEVQKWLSNQLYVGSRDIQYDDYFVSYKIWEIKSLGLEESIPKKMVIIRSHPFEVLNSRIYTIEIVRKSYKYSAMTLMISVWKESVYLFMVGGKPKYIMVPHRPLREILVREFAPGDDPIHLIIRKSILYGCYMLSDERIIINDKVDRAVNDLYTGGNIYTFIESVRLLELIAII